MYASPRIFPHAHLPPRVFRYFFATPLISHLVRARNIPTIQLIQLFHTFFHIAIFTFQQLSTFPRILINNWISQNFEVFDLAWPLTAFWPYAVFFANLFLRCYSGHIFAHISLNTRPRKMRGSRFPWPPKIYARARPSFYYFIYILEIPIGADVACPF